MNRKTFWIILLVIAAFAAGYYYSVGKNNTPVDTVRTVASAPRAAITSVPTATKAPAAQQYVLNTNTKKFHYPTCSSVKQMKDKNKKVVTMPRHEIINMGYDPCGRCHP